MNFRKQVNTSVEQSKWHAQGSIQFTVESVYRTYDEDIRLALNLENENGRSRKRNIRMQEHDIPTTLDKIKNPGINKILREVNVGDFKNACMLLKRNPSDRNECLITSLVSWNPFGRNWDQEFGSATNYFMIFCSPCGAQLYAEISIDLFDDTYRSTPSAWSCTHGHGGALTVMVRWKGAWWEVARILSKLKTK